MGNATPFYSILHFLHTCKIWPTRILCNNSESEYPVDQPRHRVLPNQGARGGAISGVCCDPNRTLTKHWGFNMRGTASFCHTRQPSRSCTTRFQPMIMQFSMLQPPFCRPTSPHSSLVVWASGLPYSGVLLDARNCTVMPGGDLV
jgi:hypothetical protein